MVKNIIINKFGGIRKKLSGQRVEEKNTESQVPRNTRPNLTRALTGGINQDEIESSRSNPQSPVSSETQAKMLRLRKLPLFVLDNSVRETTVAQIRGHTKEDKYKLLDLVLGSGGIQHVLVGVFGTRKKVDDYFCMDLRDNTGSKYKDAHLYCFSELRDEVSPDGVPSHETPIGIAMAMEYRLANVVIELDLLCPLTDWEAFGMENYCKLVMKRIRTIVEECFNPHSSTPKHNHNFINIRDFCPAWQQEPERTTYLVKFLASLPKEQRIFGIVFEDPSGSVLPCVVGDYVKQTRRIMDEQGWKDGHLLIHVHQSYGLAEAEVLEGLMNGATGIWCGIVREGAATGHANSLTTISNLHRIGNTYVRNTYNLARLRSAAIEMTQIITGDLPHPMTELYGSRAFDIVFDASTMGGTDQDEEEMMRAFDVRRKTRITTMCTPPMIEQALKEQFGPTFHVPDELPAKMVKQLEADLNVGRKEEYSSMVGFVSLYERSGGKLTVEVQEAVNSDHELDRHPLIVSLHNYCNEWRSCRRANDRMITYLQFYDGFCAKYLGCYACPLTREAFQIIDFDGNGYINWEELVFRAKWVIKEYPRNCTDIECMMKLLFEKYLVPEIAFGIRERYSLKSQKLEQFVAEHKDDSDSSEEIDDAESFEA